MTEKDNWDDFCKLMNVACESTAGKKKSAELLAFEFKLLEQYEFEDITKAVFHIIRNEKFQPQISDIVKYIEGSSSDKAFMAWEVVLKTISNQGTYKSVVFGDPRINYAIQHLGGWIKLGQMAEDEAKWIKKEFMVYYQDADKHNYTWGNTEVPDTLIGIFEASNRLEGKKIEPPEYIDCGRLNQSKQIIPALNAPQIAEYKKPDLKLIGKAVNQ